MKRCKIAEKGKLETAEVRIRAAYSKRWVLGLMVGVLAFVATVVGIVLMVRSEKAEVTAQVLANDELTMYPAVAELRGYFTYADEEVAYLWKVRVKFVNSGDKTLVGMGNQKNILGEGLNFVFPDDTRILRIEEESETFQSNMEQIEQNHFQIQFSQWRSGEYNIASFYIASERLLEAVPCPSVLTRDIIDGDVVVEDLTERRPEERKFVIDHLPKVVSTSGKIIGVVVTGFLTIVLLVMGVSGWKPAFRLEQWKNQYLSSFNDYLDQLEPPLPEREKKLFKQKPYKLPEVFWAKFDGEKVTEEPSLDSRGACIGFIIVSVFILFGLISLILMLIPA